MNLKPLHSVISGYTPNARSERTFHRVKRLQWSERKETKCWRTASFKELGKKFPADERVCSHWQISGTRRGPFLKRIVKFRRFPDNKSAIEKCGIQLFFIIIWGKIIQHQTNNNNKNTSKYTKRNKTHETKKTLSSVFLFRANLVQNGFLANGFI